MLRPSRNAVRVYHPSVFLSLITMTHQYDSSRNVVRGTITIRVLSDSIESVAYCIMYADVRNSEIRRSRRWQAWSAARLPQRLRLCIRRTDDGSEALQRLGCCSTLEHRRYCRRRKLRFGQRTDALDGLPTPCLLIVHTPLYCGAPARSRNLMATSF